MLFFYVTEHFLLIASSATDHHQRTLQVGWQQFHGFDDAEQVFPTVDRTHIQHEMLWEIRNGFFCQLPCVIGWLLLVEQRCYRLVNHFDFLLIYVVEADDVTLC